MTRISEEVQHFTEEARRMSFDRVSLVYDRLDKGQKLNSSDCDRVYNFIRSQVDMSEQKRQYQRDTKKALSKAETFESVIAKDKKELRDYGRFSNTQIEDAYRSIEAELAAKS